MVYIYVGEPFSAIRYIILRQCSGLKAKKGRNRGEKCTIFAFFSAKKTDAEADFLDFVLKMIPKMPSDKRVIKMKSYRGFYCWNFLSLSNNMSKNIFFMI